VAHRLLKSFIFEVVSPKALLPQGFKTDYGLKKVNIVTAIEK